MAIYHFSASIIQRGQGKSAVAAAAYRAGELLHDARQDMMHDYTRKKGIIYKTILLPHAAPAWMAEREMLWNAVERIEKRKDSQLAREFHISLPLELSVAQNIALAEEFVQHIFVDKGMVADLCVHDDEDEQGKRQPHAHVMLTMREVTPQGFGKKVRQWNQRNHIYDWREAWADVANKHLAMHGHDIRIDHRSLKDQGIDLEPQYKIGPRVARSRITRAEEHARIAYENGQRLLKNPTIALHAITQQQTTFSHQDLARFINRHSVDAEQFQAVYDSVKNCAELVSLGQDIYGHERFTTREMAALETTLFTQAMAQDKLLKHRVKDSRVEHASQKRTLTPEQDVALWHITQGTDIACVIGFAGTGKSHMLGAAKEVWEQSGYHVIGATLSGIAAENLELSAGICSRTLASLCWAWDKGRNKLTHKDILVIDEAGMLGTRQMTRILNEVSQAGAKIVMVGDPEQLQAIEAGGAFRGIAERVGYVELSDIRRQQTSWQKVATKELATHQTAQALKRYAESGHIHAQPSQAQARQALIEQWEQDRLSHPNKTQLILAYTREDVRMLNELARALRTADGELGAARLFQTARGERYFAEGERLYFLKNDRDLGVKNGTLGTLEAINGHTLTIRLDAESNQPIKRIVVDVGIYNHLDYGYAATVHKSQGVTVHHSYLLASQYLDRHATYVGMSRHRERASLYYSQEIFTDESALMRTLGRARTKDLIIDYQSTNSIVNEPSDDNGFTEHVLENSITASLWQNKQLTQALLPLANHSSPTLRRFIKLQKRAADFGLSKTLEVGLIALVEQIYQNPRLRREVQEKIPMLHAYSQQLVQRLNIEQTHELSRH